MQLLASCSSSSSSLLGVLLEYFAPYARVAYCSMIFCALTQPVRAPDVGLYVFRRPRYLSKLSLPSEGDQQRAGGVSGGAEEAEEGRWQYPSRRWVVLEEAVIVTGFMFTYARAEGAEHYSQIVRCKLFPNKDVSGHSYKESSQLA